MVSNSQKIKYFNSIIVSWIIMAILLKEVRMLITTKPSRGDNARSCHQRGQRSLRSRYATPRKTPPQSQRPRPVRSRNLNNPGTEHTHQHHRCIFPLIGRPRPRPRNLLGRKRRRSCCKEENLALIWFSGRRN
jgi:hypothetical protein